MGPAKRWLLLVLQPMEDLKAIESASGQVVVPVGPKYEDGWGQVYADGV